MIEAVRGEKLLGYVAIDDIEVTLDETCAVKPPDAAPTTPRLGRRREVLYVHEVVTLQKKYLMYLHQIMRFTPFINYTIL